MSIGFLLMSNRDLRRFRDKLAAGKEPVSSKNKSLSAAQQSPYGQAQDPPGLPLP